MIPDALLPAIGTAPASASPPIGGHAEIVLDLSRLLSRVLHPTPTGIDRVELGYARTLLELVPERLAFAATHPMTGRYGRLHPGAVRRFLDATEWRWQALGEAEGRGARWRHAGTTLLALRPRAIPPVRGPRVVLQVSPNALDDAPRLAARLARERARFVCLVHDLIPIAAPAFARRDGPARHAQRMANVAAHADAVIANSQATADAIAQHLHAIGVPRPRLRVLPLAGTPMPWPAGDLQTIDGPYFLCLGTIEPRKNHLLLLHLWRRMAETAGDRPVPKLVLIGRRGWENDNVFHLLDRCALLRPHVLELGRLPDRAVAVWLAGARALLMPSFAEGFGLPVVEALAAGIPVIASDLPAHREAGGDLAEYIDPLDGPAWQRRILDLADPEAGMRSLWCARLARARFPRWEDHVRRALSLVEEVARS